MRHTWMVLIVVLCIGMSLSAYAQESARESTVPAAEAEVAADGMTVTEFDDQVEVGRIDPNIYFDFDSDQLSDSAKDRLINAIEMLRDSQSLQITVEGHADERGTQQYNLTLGERRAVGVMDYLETMGGGALSGRVATISFGEDRPVCTESTDACWAKNRRAFLRISR